MTTDHQTTDSLTSLTVPAPYTVCDACGAVPTLNLPGGYQECARCHARRVMLQGAEDHLRDSLEPVHAAWAHHWSAAGLSDYHLGEALHLLSLKAVNLDDSGAVVKAAREAYPLPEYTAAPAHAL